MRHTRMGLSSDRGLQTKSHICDEREVRLRLQTDRGAWKDQRNACSHLAIQRGYPARLRLNLAQSRRLTQPAAKLDHCGKADLCSLQKSARCIAMAAILIALRENSVALTQLIPMWE